jgi:ribosome-interacting GTPase 1
MPANLTLQYLQAERRFKEATAHDDRVAALEEMIRELPKHKHTEKMFADLKTRLAKLRKEGDRKAGGPARHVVEVAIRREGAGQVLVVGGPNTGKSSILAALTNADVEVTDYPFATRVPVPGMMRYEDVPIQLVDTPSVDPGLKDPNLPALIRATDALCIVVDLSSPDFPDQPGRVFGLLDECRVRAVRGTMTTTPRQGSPRELPAFVAATKADCPDADVALELLAEVLGDGLPVVPLSVHQPATLDTFRRACFDLLGLVRVYAKAPGKEPDLGTPFLVPAGSTVIEFAEKVHRDFRERFSFARIWREGRYDGLRVARVEEVADRDVVELHVG